MDIRGKSNIYKDFLSITLDRCLDAVDGNAGSIFLFDSVKNELILESVRCPHNIIFEGLREKIGARIAGKVAQNRRPLLVKDVEKEPFLRREVLFSHYTSKSFLCVPIEYSGKLLGVVNITEKKSGEIFDNQDLRVIIEMSQHMGMALISIRHYFEQQHQENERLKKEIQLLQKKLSQDQQLFSFGKLVSGLVHEINNPLDGVIRYVNLSLNNIEDVQLTKEYLTEVQEGLRRISTVVRSLLDYAWSMPSQPRMLEVTSAIEESLVTTSSSIISKDIVVVKKFYPGFIQLPDFNLKLAFSNIINNACEAMEHGGCLTITTALEGEYYKICIEDTGHGMTDDVGTMIFDPFFTTKEKGKGVGLGLTITQDIISRYCGKIEVKSVPQQGSCFSIFLPISKNI